MIGAVRQQLDKSLAGGLWYITMQDFFNEDGAVKIRYHAEQLTAEEWRNKYEN